MAITNLDQLELVNPLRSGLHNIMDIAFLGNPLVATTNRYVVSVALSNTTLTLANQPDVPRNVTALVTDQGTPSLVAGTITVTGFDVAGNALVEVFTQPTTPAASYSFVGLKMFAGLTSIVTAGYTVLGGAQTIICGCGTMIGLPNPIVAAAAVKHVWLGSTKITSPTIATGVGTSGVDASSGVYNGVKNLQALYNLSQ
jgi:hypothetical protein